MVDDTKSEAQKARAKVLEGVDFVENEEDAEAVESAVVKIQSTFRGKKIRSKLSQKAGGDNGKEERSSATSAESSDNKATEEKEEQELNKQVAGMQVGSTNTGGGECGANEAAASNAPQAAQSVEPQQQQHPQQLGEEERAATKIQAGFKGYKTRKELENKGGGGSQGPTTGGS